MANINLTAAVRSNLSSLQNTASMMNQTSNRLSTGNKVNSALDNPTNYFTASALNSRASDLNSLMDSMANGIKTIEAADNGIKAITKVVENMQSLVRQARADKTGEGVLGVPIDVTATADATTTFDLGNGVKVDIAHGATTAKSPAELAAEINEHALLGSSVKASVDSGKLRLENKTDAAITITGEGAGSLLAGTGGGPESEVRQSLRAQFTELRTQLDRLASDAGFNGINLLAGDELKLNFSEDGNSSIKIEGKTSAGAAYGAMDSAKLGIATQGAGAFSLDTDLDNLSANLQTALGTLRTQASAYGSNLSVVQNRQDFTKSMINTLETGAGNLTLADMNQEAANMLALQTRQSLAQSTLSMANQADQGVLQLLR